MKQALEHLEKGIANCVPAATTVKAAAIHLHRSSFPFLAERNVHVIGLLFYEPKPTNYILIRIYFTVS
jgi:hypothetical protein